MQKHRSLLAIPTRTSLIPLPASLAEHYNLCVAAKPRLIDDFQEKRHKVTR